MLGSPAGVIGAVLTTASVAVALLASRLAPYYPFDTSAGRALQSPSRAHPMGTDNLGRDVLSGVVVGVQTTMQVVFWVVVIATAIGLLVGALAGWWGGLFDDVVMRLAEMFQIVPRFFLAVLVIAFFGPGLDRLIWLLGLTSWTLLARVVRAETLSLKERDFVEAARAVGAAGRTLLGRHVMPNALPAAVVVITLFASRVILIEASLSFLGLGDPTRMSLGFMASNAQPFLELAWWMGVFPGVAIVLTVLGLNMLSDAINDALHVESR